MNKETKREVIHVFFAVYYIVVFTLAMSTQAWYFVVMFFSFGPMVAIIDKKYLIQLESDKNGNVEAY